MIYCILNSIPKTWDMRFIYICMVRIFRTYKINAKTYYLKKCPIFAILIGICNIQTKTTQDTT